MTSTRDTIDKNPITSEQRSGAKRFWTTREIKILRENYPSLGLSGCLPLLPGRSASSTYQRARIEGLVAPVTSRRGVPPQRWHSSEYIDAVIRRTYQSDIRRSDIVRLATTLNRPVWWVSRRAANLGIIAPRFKEKPWSDAELDLIQSNANRTPTALSAALRRKGYSRTATAIVVKLKRLGADRTDPDHYTGRGLADLMGVDVKTVTGWIGKGWLIAGRRGTDRVPEQGGDQWWIHRRHVRQFIIENASAVDIRKVDKFWFIDLLADTTIKAEAA